jgi:hypothetical protein
MTTGYTTVLMARRIESVLNNQPGLGRDRRIERLLLALGFAVLDGDSEA